MKRLIDAYALQEWIRKNAAYFLQRPFEVIGFIEYAIKAQETVTTIEQEARHGGGNK